MVAGALLVRAIHRPVSESLNVRVYLPSGGCNGWYDFASGSFFAPGYHDVALSMEGIPAFWRAGAIVPWKSMVRRSTEHMSQDPFTLAVFLDVATETASGSLYVDDYKSHGYKDGDFLHADFEFRDGALSQAASRGSLRADVGAKVERLEIYGLRKAPVEAVLEVGGEPLATFVPASRMIDSVGVLGDSSSDPLYVTVVEQLGVDLRSSTPWRLRIIQKGGGVGCSRSGTEIGGRQAGRGHSAAVRAVSGSPGQLRTAGEVRPAHLAAPRPSLSPCLLVGLLARAWRAGVVPARR